MKKKLSIFLVLAVLVFPCLLLFTGCKDSSVVNVKVYIGETGYSFTNENPTLNFEYGETIDWSTAFSVKLVKKDGSEVDVKQGEGGYSVADEDCVLSKESLPVGTYTITITYGNFDPIKVTINVVKGVLAVPTVSGEYTYNGTEQTVRLVGFDENKMTTTNNKRTNAGTQDVVVSIVDTNSFVWADGTTEAKNISWTIKKLAVEKPSVVGEYIYNGEVQTVVLDSNFDSRIMTVSNNTRKNVGDQNLIVSLKNKENYMWTDGSSDDILTLKFEILKAMCPNPEQNTIPSFSGTYNATKKQLKDFYLPTGYRWDNENEYVYCDVKTYIAYYNTDSENYRDRTVVISLDLIKADISEISHPALTGTYDASTHLSNYALNEGFRWVNEEDVPKCNITSYDAIYNPDSRNYNDKKLSITLVLSKAEAPSCVHAPRTIVYDETKTLADYVSFLNKHCTWKNESIIPSCDVNEYEIIYNPNPVNYTDRTLTITITVTPKTLAVPTLVGTYTYNGTSQTAVLDGVDATIMVVRNNTRMIAGTQDIVVSLSNSVNYCWSNGETEISIPFTIEKLSLAGAVITLESTELEFTGNSVVPNITSVRVGDVVIYETDYTISCSNNKNVGSATLRITGKNSTIGTASVNFEIKMTLRAENFTLYGNAVIDLCEIDKIDDVNEYLKNYAVGIRYTNMYKETLYKNLKWVAQDGSEVTINGIGTYTLYPIIKGEVFTERSVTIVVTKFNPATASYDTNGFSYKQTYVIGEELEDFTNLEIKAKCASKTYINLTYSSTRKALSYYYVTTFDKTAIGTYTVELKCYDEENSENDGTIAMFNVTVVKKLDVGGINESVCSEGTYQIGTKLSNINIPIYGSVFDEETSSTATYVIGYINLADSKVVFDVTYDPYSMEAQSFTVNNYKYGELTQTIVGSVTLTNRPVDYVCVEVNGVLYVMDGGTRILPVGTTLNSYKVFAKYSFLDELVEITNTATISGFENFDDREFADNNISVVFGESYYTINLKIDNAPTNTNISVKNGENNIAFDESKTANALIEVNGNYCFYVEPEKEGVTVWYSIDGEDGRQNDTTIYVNMLNRFKPLTITIMVQDDDQMVVYYLYVKENNHIKKVFVDNEEYAGGLMISGSTIEVIPEEGYSVNINSTGSNIAVLGGYLNIEVTNIATGTVEASLLMSVNKISKLGDFTINGKQINLPYKNGYEIVNVDRLDPNGIKLVFDETRLANGVFVYEVTVLDGTIINPRTILKSNELTISNRAKSLLIYSFDDEDQYLEIEISLNFDGEPNEYIQELYVNTEKENADKIVDISISDLTIRVNGKVENLKEILESLEYTLTNGYSYVSSNYDASTNKLSFVVKKSDASGNIEMVFDVIDKTKSIISLSEFSIEGASGYRIVDINEDGSFVIGKIDATDSVNICFEIGGYGQLTGLEVFDRENNVIYSNAYSSTVVLNNLTKVGNYMVVVTLADGTTKTIVFVINAIDDTPTFELTHNEKTYNLIFGGSLGVCGDFSVVLSPSLEPVYVYAYIGKLSEGTSITVSIRTLFANKLYYDKACTLPITDLTNCTLSLLSEEGSLVAYIYNNEGGRVLSIKLICDEKPIYNYDVRFSFGDENVDYASASESSTFGDFEAKEIGSSMCLVATINAETIGVSKDNTTVMLTNIMVTNEIYGVCYNIDESKSVDEDCVILKGGQFTATSVPILSDEINGQNVRYVMFYITDISSSTPSSNIIYIILA